MAVVVLMLVMLLCGSRAYAQTGGFVDSYQLKYYAPGASAPLTQSDQFMSSAVICNLDKITPVSTVNPTRVQWDDFDHPGKACIYTVPPGSALLALPIGTYEGTITAMNSAGSAESVRASFSLATATPNARQGLIFAR